MTRYHYGYQSDYDAFSRRRFYPVESRTGGRFWAMTVYVLYVLAFFTAITAPIGVVLAYMHRYRHGPLMRETFDWQIKIFWVGVLVTIAVAVAHTFVAGIAAITFGAGSVLLVVPWAMIAAWWVWTIWAIIRGVAAVS
ncbi:hypothetical protein [Brytella acorum]|uniref:Transmembrane protein n=2 Tax=Brytella acorum TaxID=2959299 RepID=A0AA35Y1Z2_9PROT|nr:hypothetical protein [Brytella acorum]CAI9121069.1 hypothetical protein LMG32879_001914 [Brytella acorum]